MKVKYMTKALLFTFLMLAVLALPGIARAQHIAPHGVTHLGASQLVAWYDESQTFDTFNGTSQFQVTNGSTDTAVNIHVQIFADTVDDSTDRCREHDFNDTLTPTDTVVYRLADLDRSGLSMSDPGGNNAGAAIPIDVDFTRGFIVVTAVDTVTLPRQAISHNYLFGSMYTFPCEDGCVNGTPDNDEIKSAHGFNAMGRVAVDFATGAATPAGVLLDGITNGYRLLQPSFFMFSWNEADDASEEAQVVSIAFSDNYNDPNGEYRAVSATAIWDPLMYDQFEVGTSCQQHIQTCFENIGLNDDIGTDVDNEGSYLDIRLCPAVSLDGDNDSGWVDIAVSGLSGLDNNLGIIGLNGSGNRSYDAGHWMYSE